ncbi:PucR family transcriptional regulator [Streptomyces sp. SID2888]|uniref:PucR family transcriptional regulator n=1 Tax=Streptomyces sp. SID2888 TaxID=2690256 RepID=UPI001F43EFA2|nr:PucR family transcriptional regulator [Streptomyces sp. SID2888]
MPEPSPPSSAPAVPPTPPVPLSALLAREELGLRQIAGPVDPGTVIHWAHTSEMADPYPYLLGGELLLTAGVHVVPESADVVPGTAGVPETAGARETAGVPETAGAAGRGALGEAGARGDGGVSGAGALPGAGDTKAVGLDAYFDAYVSRVVEAGGAALGFGLAPVHDTVPKALVAACDRHGLPLLEVPPRTTFSGVARAVGQLMAQARLAELRRVTEAQQSLAAAAASPAPIPAVLRRLAQRVGGRAVLYGPDGAELAAAGRSEDAAVRALEELAGVVRPKAPSGSAVSAPSSASGTVAGTRLAAYTLGTGQGFVLGVATPRRDPGDHTISSVAAVLLSLLTGEHQSAGGAARSSALVRLLLGAPPEEVAPLLGGDRWVVVHARPAGERPAPDAVAAASLGAALGSTLVEVSDAVVRVLVPTEREPAAQPGWTLGVSAPVEAAGWPAADAQASRALARARATRTPLVRHGERTSLTDLVPPAQAELHARTLLAPLAQAPALVETLRSWLSLHGSWDRTAVALSVHRNTVRQRIARCAASLDADLDDPDVRMELWFALKQTGEA